MTNTRNISQPANVSALRILSLHSIECEVLDDIESMTDDEIAPYLDHLQYAGHQAFEMAAE